LLLDFRAATQHDLALLTSWTLALHQHEKQSALFPQLELQVNANFPELVQQWLAELIEHQHTLIMLAEQDQQPVGMIFGYITPQPNNFTPYPCHGVIQTIWVDPVHRRKGIAQQLVKGMETCMLDNNVPYIEIQYLPGNQEAELFWQQQGYLPAHTTSRKFLTPLQEVKQG